MNDPTPGLCCVCTGNTCRSPMLALMLEPALQRHGVQAEVYSGGVAAGSGQPASAHAVTCMQQRGLDLSGHRSRSLLELPLDRIHLFFCMGEHHAAMLIEAGVPAEQVAVVNQEQGGVPDPFGGPLEIYESTAAVLEVAADDIAAHLARAQSASSE